MTETLFMPKATAVWLVENTTLLGQTQSFVICRVGDKRHSGWRCCKRIKAYNLRRSVIQRRDRNLLKNPEKKLKLLKKLKKLKLKKEILSIHLVKKTR